MRDLPADPLGILRKNRNRPGEPARQNRNLLFEGPLPEAFRCFLSVASARRGRAAEGRCAPCYHLLTTRASELVDIAMDDANSKQPVPPASIQYVGIGELTVYLVSDDELRMIESGDPSSTYRSEERRVGE